jgi:hypothetical protein
MSMVRTKDAQRALAKIFREDAKSAAKKDGMVSKTDQTELSPFLAAKAEAFRASNPGKRLNVEALVDRAMSDAMKAWNEHNPPSSQRDHAFLSNAEVKAIAKADASLGMLTLRAVENVRQNTPISDASRVPTVTIESDVPGISVSNNGDLFTIRAAASVPVGTDFKLVVDGHSFDLRRYPGGLATYTIAGSMPEGYGADRVSDESRNGEAISVLRISKDAQGWLTTEQAVAKAREGLIEYTKNHRIKDSDWQSMMAYTTWPEAVEHGVLDDIAHFAEEDPDEGNGAIRKVDRYTFVGRGPLGLYSEVDVRKSDGKVLNSYVEID